MIDVSTTKEAKVLKMLRALESDFEVKADLYRENEDYVESLEYQSRRTLVSEIISRIELIYKINKI